MRRGSIKNLTWHKDSIIHKLVCKSHSFQEQRIHALNKTTFKPLRPSRLYFILVLVQSTVAGAWSDDIFNAIIREVRSKAEEEEGKRKWVENAYIEKKTAHNFFAQLEETNWKHKFFGNQKINLFTPVEVLEILNEYDVAISKVSIRLFEKFWFRTIENLREDRKKTKQRQTKVLFLIFNSTTLSLRNLTRFAWI